MKIIAWVIWAFGFPLRVLVALIISFAEIALEGKPFKPGSIVPKGLWRWVFVPGLSFDHDVEWGPKF